MGPALLQISRPFTKAGPFLEHFYRIRVVRGSRKISAQMPVTMATPKAGSPPEPPQPWLTERE